MCIPYNAVRVLSNGGGEQTLWCEVAMPIRPFLTRRGPSLVGMIGWGLKTHFDCFDGLYPYLLVGRKLCAVCHLGVFCVWAPFLLCGILEGSPISPAAALLSCQRLTRFSSWLSFFYPTSFLEYFLFLLFKFLKKKSFIQMSLADSQHMV